MKKTRTPMKRMKKTRTGSSLRLFIAAAVAVTVCPALFAADKNDERKSEATAPFALIAGTVYRPPGFALAGAQVVVAPEQPEASGVRLKKTEAVTNGRGEWAIRVPSVPAKWRVDVKSNGYRPEQRSVSVEREQRLELSIILEPANPLPKEATQ
jgi:hypothetical protein